MYAIAGVGSRETPDNILSEMMKIGVWCKEQGVTVRSGHADGADWAFELGAQENCVAYLPWNRFNDHLVSKAKLIVYSPNLTAEEIARKFHPHYDRLKFGVKKLMCRNVYQVLGEDLNTPSKAVVCWTQDALSGGGTGQAIRIANAYSIPVLDMAKEEYSKSDLVIAYLKERLSL